MRDKCPRCGKAHNFPPRACIQDTRISHVIHGDLGGPSFRECEFCGPMYRYIARNFPEIMKRGL